MYKRSCLLDTEGYIFDTKTLSCPFLRLFAACIALRSCLRAYFYNSCQGKYVAKVTPEPSWNTKNCGPATVNLCYRGSPKSKFLALNWISRLLRHNFRISRMSNLLLQETVSLVFVIKIGSHKYRTQLWPQISNFNQKGTKIGEFCQIVFPD